MLYLPPNSDIFAGKNYANIKKVITLILLVGVPYGESDRGILSQPVVDKVPLIKNGGKKLWVGPQSRLEETPL